jgi:DNA-binding IclR family transcriptional regulator
MMSQSMTNDTAQVQQESGQTPGRRGQKVQSAEMTMAVLKTLGELGGAATLTALAAAVKEHPAKVHRYLSSLISAGFVQQDTDSSRYVLGSESVFLGLAAQRQSDVLRLAAVEIAKLAETLNVSCFVAVMGNRGPVIVRWEEPVQSIVLNARVGSVMPMLWSATGRVFAAFQKSDLIDSLIKQELAKASEEQSRLLSNRRAVDAMLVSCREHGCSWLQGQLIKGVSALAVPIFNSNAQVAAAIVALGVSDSFCVEPQGPNAVILRKSAAAVSRRLGHALHIANSP